MRNIMVTTCLVAGAAGLLVGCSGKQNSASTAAPATGGTAAPAQAAATPKPGLWQMTVTGDAMPSPVSTKMCVGPSAPGAGASASSFTPPPQPGQTCAKNSVTRTADGYSIDTECTMNGMTMSTKGSVSGDFSSSYKTVMTSKMTGANVPAMMQTARTSTAEAKYLGACPADMKPGTVSQGA